MINFLQLRAIAILTQGELIIILPPAAYFRLCDVTAVFPSLSPCSHHCHRVPITVILFPSLSQVSHHCHSFPITVISSHHCHRFPITIICHSFPITVIAFPSHHRFPLSSLSPAHHFPAPSLPSAVIPLSPINVSDSLISSFSFCTSLSLFWQSVSILQQITQSCHSTTSTMNQLTYL